MKKYFLFLIALSISIITNAQNRKFDIRAQIAPSYTFFEIADTPPELQNGNGTYGGQKGKIGILYNFEGSYTTSKGWNYSVGYSHYIYKQHASANLSPYVFEPYSINTNLYNNSRYLFFETAKFINLNSNNLLYIGAGINFVAEKKQYIWADPVSASPSEYVSTELGSAAKLGLEHRLERGVCLGIEAKYIHLITVWGASDLSLGPYMKIKF